MPKLNENYQNLEESYLFAEIARRVKVYEESHPDNKIIRLGIGDVTKPLTKKVIAALHEAVDMQAVPETFKGYGPEKGYDFLRNAISDYYKRNGVSVDDEEAVKKILPDIRISFTGEGESKKILLNGEDVSSAIREHYVSKAASDISKLPSVRDYLVAQQRKIASETDVVLDGRDITSNVLPHAEFKFFLTASADVRAMRRYKELIARGAEIEFEKVKADIIDRDQNDSQRAYAPLVLTPDSTLIDSSDMSPEQVADLIISQVSDSNRGR